MKILIDITHPAHVHFFKYAAKIWQEHGHAVKFVARDKEVTLQLMDAYGFAYQKLSTIRKGFIGLFIELVEHQSKLYSVIKDFDPDVILNIGGTFIVHVAKLLGVKTIVFTDTEHAKLSNLITFPFASWICTPDCFMDDLGKKQVRYAGYQELAYCHPNYFKPNPEVLRTVGLEEGERFFVLRFVSWAASHDIGHQGLSEDDSHSLINELAKYGKVLMTSEAHLPESLAINQIRIPPEFMHDLIYYASLYIGEGATMASEAAIMGTPSIYINPLTSGNLEEIKKKYQLIFHFPKANGLINKIENFASKTGLKKEQKKKSKKMLNEKIDVTKWMVAFVERIV